MGLTSYLSFVPHCGATPRALLLISGCVPGLNAETQAPGANFDCKMSGVNIVCTIVERLERVCRWYHYCKDTVLDRNISSKTTRSLRAV